VSVYTNIHDVPAGYDIIYMDPPWKQTRGGKKQVRPNSSGISVPYKTMNLSDIEEYIKVVTDKSKNANVFLWVIQKYYIEANQIMKRLGFKKHTDIVWDKGNGPCPAFTVRMSHEYLQWWYKPGKIIKPVDPGKYTTVLKENHTTHSTKPEAAYRMIEVMFPNTNRIELFARNTRNQWDSFGNEIKKRLL